MISKLAATGHRPEKLGGYTQEVSDRLFTLAFEVLQQEEPDIVITGMALGWDTAVAEASCLLGIPYHAYVPFDGQERKWGKEDQRLHLNLLERADDVKFCSEPGYAAWKLMHRNKCMMQDGTKILALWDGQPAGGTYDAVKTALGLGKTILNVWGRWERLK